MTPLRALRCQKMSIGEYRRAVSAPFLGTPLIRPESIMRSSTSTSQQQGSALSILGRCVSTFRPQGSRSCLALCLIQLLFSSSNSAVVTTPLFFKANRADRMETPEMSDLDACPHLRHRIRGGLISLVCRMPLRFSVIRWQKSANSSHVIALDHVLLSSSSISGNQIRCASPAGISPSPSSHACAAVAEPRVSV